MLIELDAEDAVVLAFNVAAEEVASGAAQTLRARHNLEWRETASGLLQLDVDSRAKDRALRRELRPQEWNLENHVGLGLTGVALHEEKLTRSVDEEKVFVADCKRADVGHKGVAKSFRLIGLVRCVEEPAERSVLENVRLSQQIAAACRQSELIEAVAEQRAGIVHGADPASALGRVVRWIDHRLESCDSGKEEAVEARAPFADGVDQGEIGPELRDGFASGDAGRAIGIRQDALEDEVQTVDARITLAGEDDAVLATVRTVHGREIEAIHDRQRDVIAAYERIGVRQHAFRRRTAARQSVERRARVDHEIVAVRRVTGHQSRSRILRVE